MRLIEAKTVNLTNIDREFKHKLLIQFIIGTFTPLQVACICNNKKHGK